MNFSSLTFNSYEFVFVFLPVVVFVYWALRSTPFVNYWLAAASVFFYATSGLISPAGRTPMPVGDLS